MERAVSETANQEAPEVIRVSQWAEIRQMHLVEGIPKKQVARRLGVDVKTVRPGGGTTKVATMKTTGPSKRNPLTYSEQRDLEARRRGPQAIRERQLALHPPDPYYAKAADEEKPETSTGTEGDVFRDPPDGWAAGGER